MKPTLQNLLVKWTMQLGITEQKIALIGDDVCEYRGI
jgi:hypothetical protein